MLQCAYDVQFSAGYSGNSVPKFECQICGRSFPTLTKQRKHQDEVHHGRYSHTCHLCGKGTSSKANLRGHMAYCHHMPMDFKCTICEKEFGYKHKFIRHISKHNLLGNDDEANLD